MFAKKTRVPPEWVADFAQTVAIAQHVWEQSRPENDFPRFRPHLEKIVALRQQYASFFAPYEHIYDPLLDEFEPGMKTAEVQSIFGTLRPQQVALLQAIAGR
jgi:carboxypeptidase Taq